MAPRFLGNRPDCAYYLLIGLGVAALVTTLGGIFTYIGYWPQLAFQNYQYHHHHHNNRYQYHPNSSEPAISKPVVYSPSSSSTVPRFPVNQTSASPQPPASPLYTEYFDHDGGHISEQSIVIYSVMGPLLVTIGILMIIVIGVLALKYDCEYEPEEPKIAILRLASEMSLNFNGDSKYELMSTRPMPLPTYPSSSSAPVTGVDDVVITTGTSREVAGGGGHTSIPVA